jgi:hypothetical protein
MKTSTILIIIISIIFILYIVNKKENLSNSDKKISEMLIPNCNMLNGDYGETCNNTKGCIYNKETQGCYYNWIDII